MAIFDVASGVGLGWPSGWLHPELGCPTLGLSRVEHRPFARRVGSDKGFWPSGLKGLGVLFDELNQTRRFVRRSELNDQLQPEPEPWPSSSVLALGSGFGLCPLSRVESG